MTGTANGTTKLLGLGALVASAGVVVFGLIVTPPDVVQGELVRLIYIHPAVATWAFVAFGVTAVASLLYLVPKTRRRRWDLIAGASAEVGVVLCALTLATGSIWGRPAWGVWWTWDARLTLTALLLALFLGYLALRRTGGTIESRAIRASVAGVLFAVVVPIDHYATEWWRTLHQGDTLSRLHLRLAGRAPVPGRAAGEPAGDRGSAAGAGRPAGRGHRPDAGGSGVVSQLGYVYLGYAVTSGVLIAYSLRLLLRGRRLSRSLPAKERTWR